MICDPEMLESSRYATKLKAWQRALGTEQVLAMLYDDLRDKPQEFLDTLVDFVGVPRFTLTHSQMMCVHASETMTHPRRYHRTRRATALADSAVHRSQSFPGISCSGSTSSFGPKLRNSKVCSIGTCQCGNRSAKKPFPHPTARTDRQSLVSRCQLLPATS